MALSLVGSAWVVAWSIVTESRVLAVVDRFWGRGASLPAGSVIGEALPAYCTTTVPPPLGAVSRVRLMVGSESPEQVAPVTVTGLPFTVARKSSACTVLHSTA